MKGNASKEVVDNAKSRYFAAADAALAKNSLDDASADAFRRLIKTSKKPVKPAGKKTAS